MNKLFMPFVLLLASAAALAASDRDRAESQPDQPPGQKVSYSKDVAPILQKHCAECHVAGQEGTEATGFRVDSYKSLMQGSQYGPVIKPGNASTSSLYVLISAGDHLIVNMPRGRPPLSGEEIGIIRAWIDNGALEN
jgi:Planctomycete cytochrome C